LYRFIIDLGFTKFKIEKRQTTITFDKELGLRSSKNESCSKWGNKFTGQRPKAVGPPKIPKFHHLGFLFYFFVIFTYFFRLYPFILFHISILATKF